MTRIHRRSARVLPVSPGGEVLLVQDTDPGDPARGAYWASIGGAIDPGESPADAAVRELWEETGIRVSVEALIGPIHQAEHDFSWNGVDYRGDTTHFAVVVDRDVAITFDNLEPIEVASMVQAGWLSPQAVRAHGAWAPDTLPEIIEIALEAASPDGVRGEM